MIFALIKEQLHYVKEQILSFLSWFFYPLIWLWKHFWWAHWLAEHPKLWVPILSGTAIGIFAFFRQRKAKRDRDHFTDTDDLP